MQFMYHKSFFYRIPQKNYNPINSIPTPQIKIVKPATACMYLSRNFIGSIFNPNKGSRTMAIMVDIVVILNTAATVTTPRVLCLAAGNINNGIKGSQGPKTNIVNNIQGVTFTLVSNGCS